MKIAKVSKEDSKETSPRFPFLLYNPLHQYTGKGFKAVKEEDVRTNKHK